MWKTNLEVDLPEGYVVRENEDFFFLLKIKKESEELIQIFGKSRNPAHKIARKAIEHLNTNC